MFLFALFSKSISLVFDTKILLHIRNREVVFCPSGWPYMTKKGGQNTNSRVVGILALDFVHPSPKIALCR